MHDMRNGICALCNHPEVIDAPAIEYTGEGESVRLAVAHVPAPLEFIPSSTRTVDDRPYGLLRVLVCRSCGFVQWFASKPRNIPIDQSSDTKLITPKSTP